MQVRNFSYLIISGILIILTQFSCEKKEQDISLCTDGYVEENGECICPENLIEWGYSCLELNELITQENEYLVELPKDCSCRDKLILGLGPSTANDYEGIIRNMSVLYFGGGAFSGYDCYYTKKPDGDEISIGGINGSFLSIECLNGDYQQVRASGKFNADNTEMALEWIWINDDGSPVDTCMATLRR